MKESKVIFQNGCPVLAVDGEKMPALAYITYFEENNDYELFAENGFRLFSVSVGLSNQPINAASGFTPHAGGVFDQKGCVDFTSVDAAIKLIVDACPNAYIFPRVYICMPQWWIDENPTETIPVPHDKRREALYSEKFRKDAASMLVELIEHFKTFEYADHIIGYQISGGGTQEWFHIDLNGSYHENALPYFQKYLGEEIEKLPDLNGFSQDKILDPLLTKYLRFTNESVAETVAYFCEVAKAALENKQIVGVFYGYTLEVVSPLWGTHALAKLLDCPHIDFFSSPNSYVNNRAMGIDWPDMMPVDTIQLHGKMCFIECDIRTYRTTLPSEARKGCDPYHVYVGNVWQGPPTEELSAFAVRKSLARQLTHKHGLWWFDMFGHWYNTTGLMEEMRLSQKLYRRIGEQGWEFPVEVALFVDENAYSKIGRVHPQHTLVRDMREVWAKIGAPCHVYLTSDFDKIHWNNSPYKAVLFMIPEGETYASQAQAQLRQYGIATLYVAQQMTCEALRRFLGSSGVWLFTETEDVLYVGNGYAALHAATAGAKKISLPQTVNCTDVVTNETKTTNLLSFECKQYETRIFALKESK